MDLTAYYAEIRTDLKDSGALWTDPELKRSVERAVLDLSRFMPLEAVYEQTLVVTVADESFTTPTTTAATAYVNAEDISASTDGDTATIADQTPDVPRRVTFTLTDANASITELTVIVKGADADGQYIEEWFYLWNGLTQIGEKQFKTINEVEIHNIAGGGASDTLSIGHSTGFAEWQNLANRVIKPETESITSDPAGTTYTRNTDYYMDYANGRIQIISGGSMAVNTGFLAGYTKSRIAIDMAAILPVMTRMARVEYPVDKIPQQFVTNTNIWDGILWIGSQFTGSSQTQMTDSEHIAIYYEREHTAPSLYTSGSFPRFMDQVVTLGAEAYALFIKAYQAEHQAVLDLATIRTELGLTTDIHTLLTAAQVNVEKYLHDNGTSDAVSAVGNIVTRVVELHLKIEAALDVMSGYLDDVDTTDLGKADVGAEALLETGDGLINTHTVNGQAVQNYAAYSQSRVLIAQARTQAALGYAQEAAARLSAVRSYIEESGSYQGIAAGFAGKVSGYLNQINAYLGEASQYQSVVLGNLELADRWRAEAIEKRAEFHSTLRNRQEYRSRTAIVAGKQPA